MYALSPARFWVFCERQNFHLNTSIALAILMHSEGLSTLHSIARRHHDEFSVNNATSRAGQTPNPGFAAHDLRVAPFSPLCAALPLPTGCRLNLMVSAGAVFLSLWHYMRQLIILSSAPACCAPEPLGAAKHSQQAVLNSASAHPLMPQKRKLRSVKSLLAPSRKANTGKAAWMS